MKDQQYIHGIHAVNALLNTNHDCIRQLIVDNKRSDKRIQDIIHRAERLEISLIFQSRAELDHLANNGNHQGIVALCDIPAVKQEQALDDLLKNPDHALLFLVLDGVQDPHNLGACLRTADAAGVDALIIPKDRSVSMTSTVVKVASGAAYTVPVIHVTNLSRALTRMQDAGVWFVGTDGASSQTLYELNLTGSIGIVMGAEGRGMRRLTKEKCDFLVQLPMLGSVESLNVSVATGICLYEVLRQRKGQVSGN